MCRITQGRLDTLGTPLLSANPRLNVLRAYRRYHAIMECTIHIYMECAITTAYTSWVPASAPASHRPLAKGGSHTQKSSLYQRTSRASLRDLEGVAWATSYAPRASLRD